MKLVASSVVRGSNTVTGSGGLYLVDLETRSIQQPIVLADPGFEWVESGRERGLRGIAFDDDRMYCAASDALYAFDTAFEFQERYTNSYLQYCRGIAVVERKLFIVSSGCDSIIGFNLDTHKFDWALQIKSRGPAIGAHPFDPAGDDGPLLISKLDLRGIYCDGTGMYITCNLGLLRFTGRAVGIAIELPPGANDARPFRNGVLFNDSDAGKLRYADRGEGDEDRSLSTGSFNRGLCTLNGAVVAAGLGPSGIAVYDLAANQRLLKVQMSAAANEAIHSMSVWPFD